MEEKLKNELKDIRETLTDSVTHLRKFIFEDGGYKMCQATGSREHVFSLEKALKAIGMVNAILYQKS